MILKISVVMPVFNEEKYVGKAIESILNQTFTDFEFIIIDDGSTDDSVKIIKSYKDARIKFFKSENKGMVDQFNFGILNSAAPLIARMDADDIAGQNRFEVQLDTLNKNHEIDVLGTNVLFIDEDDGVICEKKYPEFHDDIEFMMPVESSVCHPSVIMRKETVLKTGLYKNDYGYAADFALFLNMIYRGYKFYNIQQTLLKYRPRFMRTDVSRMKDSNSISYNLGVDYLNKLSTTSSGIQSEYNYYFRMALIEYYRGSMSRARQFFFKALLIRKDKALKLLRYILITLLGQRIVNSLRRKVFPKLSLFINRTMKIDFHRIGK